MTDKINQPKPLRPSTGVRRVWAQRVWPNGGSRVLLTDEQMKEQASADETERFLELERRRLAARGDGR